MSREFFLSHLCVSSLIWRGRPVQEMASTMMRLGLTHLELAAEPDAPGHYRPGESNSLLFNLLAEAGARVTALRIMGLDHGQKIRAIAEAGERGIPAVVDRAERLVFPDLIDRLRLYAACASHGGVHYLLETDSGTVVDNAAAQMTLSKIVAHSALGFSLSTRAAVEDRKNPGDEARELTGTLRMARLWDSPILIGAPSAAEASNQTFVQDHPLVEWESYFRALSEVQFRGIIALGWEGTEACEAPWTERAIIHSLRFYLRAAEGVQFGSAKKA